MVTVAEQLRKENADRAARMTPKERLSEALALGRAAVLAHAQAHQLDVATAQRRLERAGQAGRRSSRVMLRALD
jgi:PIN domain nuclease of toxin-antitoxin system